MPVYSDSPLPVTGSNVPLARRAPDAPASSRVPPVMNCRSMISPVPIVWKAPALLKKRSPSLVPRRARMTPSPGNGRPTVVGVCEVGLREVAVTRDVDGHLTACVAADPAYCLRSSVDNAWRARCSRTLTAVGVIESASATSFVESSSMSRSTSTAR